jgi:hypothetical protein
MAAFLVLSPANGNASDADCRFIRDGFSWTAALFPVLHSLWHGLFLDAAILFVLRALGLFALTDPRLSGTAFLLLAVPSLLHGFEAGNRLATTLQKQGWHGEGAICARTLADAEAIHYGEADESVAEDPVFRFDPDAGRTKTSAGKSRLQFGLIDLHRGR